MANTIEYAKVFQTELDKQIVQQATSGWMEDNAKMFQYNGGAEIKVPKLEMQGLADYSRSSGYTDGAVIFSYETFTMQMDRNRRFRLDSMDVNETNFVLSAGNVMSEFQRTKVIPEIDAYRYSKLAAAAAITSTYTAAASTIISKLYEDITNVQDVGGDDLVIVISRKVYSLLTTNDKIKVNIDAGKFTQGKVDMAIKLLDGIPLIPVPSARMKSEYTFNPDGEGGFTPTDSAKSINWIVCPKSVPIGVSKTDNVKIITPELNQFADAWDIDYRKYHDMFVPENKKAAIAVSFSG